jgi:glutamine amidotransferase
MITLIDYGAGNVRSVHKALIAVGAEVRITSDPNALDGVAKIVLPGVGAFGECMAALRRLGLVEAICIAVQGGASLLGICVGLQVLFEEGNEMGRHCGLGLLPGRVVRFACSPLLPGERTGVSLKIPHTGWNQVTPARPAPLLRDVPPGAWAYFNHAYFCQAQPEHVLAVTDYGGAFPSVVGRGLINGVQFHPEKSQQVGLHVLRNFVEGVA